MTPYAVFCSHQMAACKYLQEKNADSEFKEYQQVVIIYFMHLL